MFFFIIPGIIIYMAWLFAPLITIDKGKNPTEAITLSNNATYGNKWRIFAIFFLISLAYFILVTVFNFIPFIGILLVIAVALLYMFVFIGVMASMYRQLTENI